MLAAVAAFVVFPPCPVGPGVVVRAPRCETASETWKDRALGEVTEVRIPPVAVEGADRIVRQVIVLRTRRRLPLSAFAGAWRLRHGCAVEPVRGPPRQLTWQTSCVGGDSGYLRMAPLATGAGVVEIIVARQAHIGDGPLPPLEPAFAAFVAGVRLTR